jgi:hypothetical protein
MSYLPLVALFMVPRNRRRNLLPLALPAVANVPAAQAGALAVVTADSALRREQSASVAEATTAVTQTIAKAVEKGATLEAVDFEAIPIAHHVVITNPQILEHLTQETLSAGQQAQVAEMIEAAVGQPTGTGGPVTGGGTGAGGGSTPTGGGTGTTGGGTGAGGGSTPTGGGTGTTGGGTGAGGGSTPTGGGTGTTGGGGAGGGSTPTGGGTGTTGAGGSGGPSTTTGPSGPPTP